MRRLVLLTVLSIALATFVSAQATTTPAESKEKPQGNWIVCPKGSLQNAAGTTCTDRKTGDFVKPKKKHTEFKGGYPCPEFWKVRKDGSGCDKDRKAIRHFRHRLDREERRS